MNRAMLPIQADKDNMSDFWKLTCATAELLATLAGVEKRYEALLKFTKTLGEVGVKLIEPRPSGQTSSGGDGPAASPQTRTGALNIEPMLHFLGIEGISLPAENLLTLLRGRFIETSSFGVHLSENHWSESARRWHEGSVHVLEDSRLYLRDRAGAPPSLVLSFGSVRLGREHRERTSIELVPDHTVPSSSELVVVRERMESQEVRVRLEYWPDAKQVLRSVGIRITGRSGKIPAFRATASTLDGTVPAYECIVLVEEAPNVRHA